MIRVPRLADFLASSGKFEMRTGGYFETRKGGKFEMRKPGRFEMPIGGNFDELTQMSLRHRRRRASSSLCWACSFLSYARLL